MCGIFGFFSFQNEDSRKSDNRMQVMLQALKHRGPDDDGYFINDHVGLGNTRLAILGLEDGHQPMYSEDNSIVVVQNGEIYNYVELQQEVGVCKTNCDTEIILKLYEKYGPNFVSKLNGMFAIALYDKKIDKLFLYRDRIGVKPLYFYNNGNALFFSSEIKPILYTNDKFKINYSALNSLLTFNYVLPPETMYKGIKHLMPGYYVSISRDNNATFSQWWNLADIKPNKNLQEKDQIILLQDLLKDAVKLRLRSDVPCGAFLSGGIDSSSVVGYMSQIDPNHIKTFSIGFNDKRFDETVYIEEAVKRFGTISHLQRQDYDIEKDWNCVIHHCEQPHGDVSFIPTLLVSKLAHANGMKVILTGDGGDELFGGYEKYWKILSGDSFLSEFSVFQDKDKKFLTLDKFEDDFLHFTTRQHFEKFKDQDKVNQILAFDTLYLLSGNNLVKPDRMGMAVGVETRSPFLDYRMVEFAFSIEGKYKLKNQTTKYIYKKAVENLIGKNLTYRKKQMFTVPIGEWFRTSLKSFAYELLNKKQSFISEILNLEFINKMFQIHCDGKVNYTRQIRLLLALQIWWEQFKGFCDL